LLQELALLKKENNYELAETRRRVERISRKIRDDYWNELTRTIDKKGLMQILEDEKTSNEIPTLYVSSKDKQGGSIFRIWKMNWEILKSEFARRLFLMNI
jgi:alpha,alpha-trehalase